MGATNRTTYGETRISTKSFYVHHSQMLSKAAVMHDAKAIRKQITCLKQRVCAAAHAADGGGLTVGRVRKPALPPASRFRRGPESERDPDCCARLGCARACDVTRSVVCEGRCSVGCACACDVTRSVVCES